MSDNENQKAGRVLIELSFDRDDLDLDEEPYIHPDLRKDFQFPSYRSVLHKYGKYFQIIDNEDYPLKRKPRDPVKRWLTALKFSNDDLIYTEGVVIIDNDINPYSSAWLIDRRTCKVIDPTFHNRGLAYFGIPFVRDFVIQHASKAGVVGILVSDKGIGAEIVKFGLPEECIWTPEK